MVEPAGAAPFTHAVLEALKASASYPAAVGHNLSQWNVGDHASDIESRLERVAAYGAARLATGRVRRAMQAAATATPNSVAAAHAHSLLLAERRTLVRMLLIHRALIVGLKSIEQTGDALGSLGGARGIVEAGADDEFLRLVEDFASTSQSCAAAVERGRGRGTAAVADAEEQTMRPSGAAANVTDAEAQVQAADVAIARKSDPSTLTFIGQWLGGLASRLDATRLVADAQKSVEAGAHVLQLLADEPLLARVLTPGHITELSAHTAAAQRARMAQLAAASAAPNAELPSHTALRLLSELSL